LSYELRMLAYSAFLCLLLWVPYTLAAIQARGLGPVAGYPTGKYEDLPAWAQRSQRAHMNLVENLAPFAALILFSSGHACCRPAFTSPVFPGCAPCASPSPGPAT
jgi:uncharacterized MAPEG superfamily protein